MRIFVLLIVGAAWGHAAVAAVAQARLEPPRPDILAPGAPPDLEDTVALGSFVDGVIQAHLDRIPAAVIAIVKDQRVLYARGYGHADIEKGTPVDPATALFHIGSTGKLFTWTAVMQLVEQGKLDLDADVNTYLGDFRIPATFPQPITLRHLLTHTAGFEEGILGYYLTEDSTNISTIEDVVTGHVPTRVRAPGILASYSNYGAALAGLIIQRVSGMPFVEYIERHLYQPLGIRYATFREPLPSTLRPYGVTGYARENGAYVAKPYEIDGGWVPAGGTSASALDIARFMIAHLHQGRYGDVRILGPETARLMHSPAFRHDPRLSAMTLGFQEQHINGLRVIGHGGDSFWFHADLFLVPDHRVGLFFSYVGEGSVPVRERIKETFFDRYFPAPEEHPTGPPADFGRTARKYAGTYRFIRMNYTDLDKVVWLLLPPIRVSVLSNDRLLLAGGFSDEPMQLTPIDRNLFQEVGGATRIAFRENAAGEITHLFYDNEPTTAAERVPWYEVPSFWYLVLGTALFLFLTALADLVYRRKEIRAMAKAEKRAVTLSAVTVGWLLLTVLGAGAVIASYRSALLGHIPLAFKVVLAMPLLFVALAVAMVIASVKAWRRRYWTPGRRLHFTLVALAALAVSWFFYQWNILGWQFG